MRRQQGGNINIIIYDIYNVKNVEAIWEPVTIDFPIRMSVSSLI